MVKTESGYVYKPIECGWALEFKIAGSLGKTGMWQCVLGRESLMIYGSSGPAGKFFTEVLRGLPDFLGISDFPGDMDHESRANLMLSPAQKGIFMMTSADRWEIYPPESAERMEDLREAAENLVDHVFGYLRSDHFMPVAGPASVWRFIISA